MKRAESALATAKRLAALADEEKRLTWVVRRATNTCGDGGYLEGPGEEPGGVVSHLTMYLGHGGMHFRERMRACPACSAAYEAIQERRALRRRRGALRAALVRIGRAALRDEGRS